VRTFATGRQPLVAAAGEREFTRGLDGALPPVAASHTSTTRWAFLKRNCSDRSWCATQTVGTYKAATPVSKTHVTDSTEKPKKEKDQDRF